MKKRFATTLALLLLVGALTTGARCEAQESRNAGSGSKTKEPRAGGSAIPKRYLKLYKAAGGKYELDWTYIAAIGKVESDHGRTPLPGVHSGANYAGAMGPMQFMPRTWKQYGRGNVYNPADAIPAAARYLRASGAPRDWPDAIFAYNHSKAYVADVMAARKSIRQRY